jgi:hypothetical protein
MAEHLLRLLTTPGLPAAARRDDGGAKEKDWLTRPGTGDGAGFS